MDESVASLEQLLGFVAEMPAHSVGHGGTGLIKVGDHGGGVILHRKVLGVSDAVSEYRNPLSSGDVCEQLFLYFGIIDVLDTVLVVKVDVILRDVAQNLDGIVVQIHAGLFSSEVVDRDLAGNAFDIGVRDSFRGGRFDVHVGHHALFKSMAEE